MQMVIGSLTCVFLLYAPTWIGLSGIWIGLALFMGIRSIAGFMRYVRFSHRVHTFLYKSTCCFSRKHNLIFRLNSREGPWKFLHEEAYQLQVVISHIMVIMMPPRLPASVGDLIF